MSFICSQMCVIIKIISIMNQYMAHLKALYQSFKNDHIWFLNTRNILLTNHFYRNIILEKTFAKSFLYKKIFVRGNVRFVPFVFI